MAGRPKGSKDRYRRKRRWKKKPEHIRLSEEVQTKRKIGRPKGSKSINGEWRRTNAEIIEEYQQAAERGDVEAMRRMQHLKVLNRNWNHWKE